MSCLPFIQSLRPSSSSVWPALSADADCTPGHNEYPRQGFTALDVFLAVQVDFTFEQIIDYVAKRFEHRDHCVIVVAEGAGQDNIR